MVSSNEGKPTLADVADAVEQSPQIGYAVNADLRVEYCNSAWNQFAEQNGAPDLAGDGAIGIDLPSVLGHDLRPFYWVFEPSVVSQVSDENSSPACTRMVAGNERTGD